MKFIVDESSGMAVTHYLRNAGYDAINVGEIMPRAHDKAILARAKKDHRILITNDKDFGELIFRSGYPHFGVILLRLYDESPANRAKVIKLVLEQYAHRLKRRFTVATDTDVRIRSFPELI
jgi:predicted nuclease of predicted toxin-antitoxin system